MTDATEIDFDPQNSDLQIGIEVEYPKQSPSDELFVHRGGSTSSLQSAIDRLPRSYDASPVYDGTVGLEIVSDPLDLADAKNWYTDVIEYVEDEYGEYYQPVGLMKRGSTAGTHIHISSINESKAQALAELSKEPWLQVLFCSSIARNDDSLTWPVFRGGQYCDLHYSPTGGHYAVVNRRGSGHYEWRLPEPMVPEHMEILTKFLRAFEQSVDAAIEYGQEVLDDGDDRITAIKRAEAVGMDIETMPEVRQEPSPDDPENFYETISNSWMYPDVYRVDHDGEQFYVLRSDMSGELTVPVLDMQIPVNGVLYADSLENVDDPATREDVERAFERHFGGDGQRETEATHQLKEIIKKKKGKA